MDFLKRKPKDLDAAEMDEHDALDASTPERGVAAIASGSYAIDATRQRPGTRRRRPETP